MSSNARQIPLLYSFRRCPYAMRARMALAQAGIAVELREVLLKDKPEQMLELSPKGTVPVLLATGGEVVEESINVMHWALKQNDPEGWLDSAESDALIQENDGEFKSALDRYKYHTRHPEHPREHYRAQGEVFLQKLETRLEKNAGAALAGPTTSLADIAIFPFIRQFAGADADWFSTSPYPHLRAWLDKWVNSELFLRVMKKRQPWLESDEPVIEFWVLPD